MSKRNFLLANACLLILLNLMIFQNVTAQSQDNEEEREQSICSNDPDEYVCNGDFEQPFTPNVFGPGLTGPYYMNPGISVFECIGNNLGPNCYVPYWTHGENTPDIYSRLFNGSNPNFPYWLHGSLPYGNLDSPSGGNSIAHIVDFSDSSPQPRTIPGFSNRMSGTYTETFLTKLRTPLVVGQEYQISYDVIAHNSPLAFYIHDPINDANVGGTQGCIEISPAPGLSPNHTHCERIQLTTTGPANWTHVSYRYTPRTSDQFLTAYGNTSAVNPSPYTNASYFFDNFSIKPVVNTCVADSNSLTVPNRVSYSNLGYTTTSWNTQGSCGLILEFETGGGWYRYHPTTPSGTFTVPNYSFSTGQGLTDNSLHVTLLAAGSNGLKSITKDVAITQLPLPAAVNQCEITNLTTTPVPLGGGNTTLSWTSPARCMVFIEKWAADPTLPYGMSLERVNPVPDTYPHSHPSSSSISVPVTRPTTLHLHAQTGSNNEQVVFVRTIDIAPQ